jgi:multidrug efflux system membrane fusion protein
VEALKWPRSDIEVSFKSAIKFESDFMRKSFLLAGALLLVVTLWLLSGQFGSDAPGPQPDTAGAAGETEEIMTVQVRKLGLEPYVSELTISGRTESVRSVEVKSQTDGQVTKVPVEKGRAVKTGDVICQLETTEREANLAEAKALMAQRELEYNAARELAAKGHRSETQTAAARAQFDAAKARVAKAELELSHASIRAPFDGIIDDRPAEIGDYLQKGHICARIVDTDPFLVVGEISEREVGNLKVGDKGEARLVDGTRVEGRIRYIAETATPETRTFLFELEVPNPEGNMREGVTAQIRIPLHEVQAYRMSRASLVLNDQGLIGVRLVEDNVVRFHQVRILGDSTEGIWVDGLPENPVLITVGQDFVIDGQQVRVKFEG